MPVLRRSGERGKSSRYGATNSCSRRAARACMSSSPLRWPRILPGRGTYSVNCAQEELCGHALRRVADDGCCGLLLDWQLEIRPIDRESARALWLPATTLSCRPPVIWRFHTAIYNGAHAFRRRDRWKSSRASTERARDCRSQSALHPAGHRCSAPLECCLNALWLVRARSRSAGMAKNHYLHTGR